MLSPNLQTENRKFKKTKQGLSVYLSREALGSFPEREEGEDKKRHKGTAWLSFLFNQRLVDKHKYSTITSDHSSYFTHRPLSEI